MSDSLRYVSTNSIASVRIIIGDVTNILVTRNFLVFLQLFFPSLPRQITARLET